jgi:hypothetical protein
MEMECPICHQKFRAQGFTTHLKSEIKKLALEIAEEAIKKQREENMQAGNPEMCVKKHVFVGSGRYCQDCGHLALADCHCPPWEVPPDPATKLKSDIDENLTAINNFFDNLDELMKLYRRLIGERDTWIINAKRWASKVIELQELIARGD